MFVNILQRRAQQSDSCLHMVKHKPTLLRLLSTCIVIKDYLQSLHKFSGDRSIDQAESPIPEGLFEPMLLYTSSI
jgi:hypothetical protein